jgi:hypothetical protein
MKLKERMTIKEMEELVKKYGELISPRTYLLPVDDVILPSDFPNRWVMYNGLLNQLDDIDNDPKLTFGPITDPERFIYQQRNGKLYLTIKYPSN